MYLSMNLAICFKSLISSWFFNWLRIMIAICFSSKYFDFNSSSANLKKSCLFNFDFSSLYVCFPIAFASGFMLIFYRPLKIGEDVEVAGVRAVVKTVGASACTFADKDNNLVVIPNSKIWGNVIKNFDRLKKE